MVSSERPAYTVSLLCGAIALLGGVGMLGVKMLCAAILHIGMQTRSADTFAACVGYVGASVDKFAYVFLLAGLVLISLALLVGDRRTGRNPEAE
jgi:hypothetical protein